MEDVLAARRTSTWREKVKVMAGPFGLRGGRDRFYRNNGDGTFGDATDEAGMTDMAESYGLGVLASDLDNDGDVDVFVANDSNPNFLYRNDGDGTSPRSAPGAGPGSTARAWRRPAWGSTRPTSTATACRTSSSPPSRRTTPRSTTTWGTSPSRTSASRLALKAITYETLNWGCAFFDFDHDADVDLVIANGHIYPQVDEAPELNESYRQLPTFCATTAADSSDVSRNAGPGMQVAASARGLAVGDYDDDGDLDLLITRHRRPAALAPQRHAAVGPLAEAPPAEPPRQPRR